LLTSALLEIGHTLGVIDNPTIWTSPKAVGVGDQHYFTQVYNLSLDTHNRIPNLPKTGSGKQIAPVTRIGLGIGTPNMFVDDPQGAGHIAFIPGGPADVMMGFRPDNDRYLVSDLDAAIMQEYEGYQVNFPHLAQAVKHLHGSAPLVRTADQVGLR
jgi:hypothetical protein